MNGAKILVLGVAYKQNIADFRESPAINVIKELQKRSAEIAYYDPWVPSFRWKGMSMTGIPALTEEALREADLVMVTTRTRTWTMPSCRKTQNLFSTPRTR